MCLLSLLLRFTLVRPATTVCVVVTHCFTARLFFLPSPTCFVDVAHWSRLAQFRFVAPSLAIAKPALKLKGKEEEYRKQGDIYDRISQHIEFHRWQLTSRVASGATQSPSKGKYSLYRVLFLIKRDCQHLLTMPPDHAIRTRLSTSPIQLYEDGSWYPPST